MPKRTCLSVTSSLLAGKTIKASTIQILYLEIFGAGQIIHKFIPECRQQPLERVSGYEKSRVVPETTFRLLGTQLRQSQCGVFGMC